MIERRDLEVVAEAGVARRERAPQGVPVARLERDPDLEHALVLGAHVPQPPRIARLDLGAAPRVAGLVQSARAARVDHEQLEVARERHLPVLARPAVVEERVAGASQQRGRLVQQAARHPDRALLRTAAELGELEAVDLAPLCVAERERRGHLERGRRGQACARGEVRDDPPAEAGRRPELGGDRAHVAAPALVGAEALRGEVDLLAAGLADDGDSEVQRDREHEPAAVVRVLADQVDAPGRAEDVRSAQRRAARAISA
jgi:hypothetical protein